MMDALLNRTRIGRPVRRSTAVLLLAGGAALPLAAGPASAATFNFTGDDGANIENADNWTLVPGTGPADSGSPPPANGDIGTISGEADFGFYIYDLDEDPPAEIDILTGGSLRLLTSIDEDGSNHNLVMDGGNFTAHANYGYTGKFFVKSDSFLGGVGETNHGPNLDGQILDYDATHTGKLTVQTETWKLKGDNSGFSGGFDVQSGAALQANGSSTEAFGTGDTVVHSGGEISWSETGGTYSNDFVLDGGKMTWVNNRGVTATLRLRSESTLSNDGGGAAWKGVIGDDGANAGRLNYVGRSDGDFDLTQTNTYTGGTTVDAVGEVVTGGRNGPEFVPSTNHLNANVAGALGFGDVDVTSTGLLHLNDLGAIDPGAVLTIESGTNGNGDASTGEVTLNASQTVAGLILGGTAIDPGTYEATDSANGVDFSNYFIAGTPESTITVAAVPEPASLALLGLGGGLMMLRRRRRGAPEA